MIHTLEGFTEELGLKPLGPSAGRWNNASVNLGWKTGFLFEGLECANKIAEVCQPLAAPAVPFARQCRSKDALRIALLVSWGPAELAMQKSEDRANSPALPCALRFVALQQCSLGSLEGDLRASTP